MKPFLVVILLALGTAFILTGMYSSQRELSLLKNIGETISLANVKNISHYLFIIRPSATNRSFIGKENAPILFLAYLDFSSPTSEAFLTETYPELYQDYITTGKIKYLPKYYLTTEDYHLKTERFIYAQTTLCINRLSPRYYGEAYFTLFNTDTQHIDNLVRSYNISMESFHTCLEQADFEELRQDSMETEMLSLIGFNPVFYVGIDHPERRIYGIPSYERIQRIIKDYQIEIGD